MKALKIQLLNQLTITATSDPVQVYSAEIDQYGTTGASLGVCHMNNNCTAEYTFEFSTDIKVYEVGFVVGAVNDPYSIIWHYSDGTTETENKVDKVIQIYLLCMMTSIKLLLITMQ